MLAAESRVMEPLLEDSVVEVIDLSSEVDNSVVIVESEGDQGGNFYLIDSTPDYSFLDDKIEAERFWENSLKLRKRKRRRQEEEVVVQKVGGTIEKWVNIEDGEVWTEMVPPEVKRSKMNNRQTEGKKNNKHMCVRENGPKMKENRNIQKMKVIDLTESDNETDCTPLTIVPKPQTHSHLRPVIIDGCNVAFGHGKNKFSSKGLAICIKYFEERGHSVTAFIPQFRRRHPATLDHEVLDHLEDRGVVVYTPSRSVRGRLVVPYDDRYIVEYAAKVGGVIVSRDNYRDLLSENSEWSDVINNRLLMYTWAKDTIMFPQDPLGRFGPSLKQFLSFSS